MSDKREMIERVLNKYDAFYGKGTSDDDAILVDLNALAEQAIAIECEVEHTGLYDSLEFKSHAVKWTNLSCRGTIFARLQSVHHGTPGKALAIIVPLEND